MGEDLCRVWSWVTWLVQWALNELINYFNLLSPLTLSQVQFFSYPSQMWDGFTLGQDLCRVHSWETWPVYWVLNELIIYLDLPSPLPLSLVQFFSDRSQIWLRHTLKQNLGAVCLRVTWLVKWALNELINHFDLPSMLLLSWVGFFSDHGQTWQGRTLGKISAKFLRGRHGWLSECLTS